MKKFFEFMKWTLEQNEELTREFITELCRVVLRPTMAKLSEKNSKDVHAKQFLRETQFNLIFRRTRTKPKVWSVGEALPNSQFGHVAALMVGCHTDFGSIDSISTALMAYLKALEIHVKHCELELPEFTQYEFLAACVVAYLKTQHEEPICEWLSQEMVEINEIAMKAEVQQSRLRETFLRLVALVEAIESRLDIESWFDLDFVDDRPPDEPLNV